MDFVVRHEDSRKQGRARHPTIAVAIIVPYEPIVSPEPVRAAPCKARNDLRRGEAFIETSRYRSSREAYFEAAFACLQERAESFNCTVRKHFGILEYVIFGHHLT
jgi:hypothetical protein